MTSSNPDALISEYRKEAQASFGRVMLFGSTLTLSHLIDVDLKDLNMVGVSISVHDELVVYAVLAFVLLFYISQWAEARVNESSLIPNAYRVRALRSAFFSRPLFRSKDYDWKKAKTKAREYIRFVGAVLAFRVLMTVTIVMIGSFLAVLDIVNFIGYLLTEYRIW